MQNYKKYNDDEVYNLETMEIGNAPSNTAYNLYFYDTFERVYIPCPNLRCRTCDVNTGACLSCFKSHSLSGSDCILVAASGTWFAF